MSKFENFRFEASDTILAQEAFAELTSIYGQAQTSEADIVVALGGDGFMLQTIHDTFDSQLPIFGMNKGTVGFLMNNYSPEGLPERLNNAIHTDIAPLRMVATDEAGQTHTALAINEVSLLRQSYQAARLDISVDGHKRMEGLVCDGVLVATAAGSTAYNYSAHGPILPIDAQLLALTPVSPFRPRRWRGALLPQRVSITIDVMEAHKRPVNAVADHFEVKSVVKVEVARCRELGARLMFDQNHSWNERILAEQFSY
ncbi:MAG: NAD kinase [Pseudomonadota bacterium]